MRSAGVVVPLGERAPDRSDEGLVRARGGRGVGLRVLGSGGAGTGQGGGLERAPAGVRAKRRLVDSHGRTIRDLRLSVTDRCNFRCVYCMEPDVRFAAREELLTCGELVRVARVAERLGVRKIRLTGGEPTVHPELEGIIRGVRAATGVELAMITNGSRVDAARARAWKRAGLDRVTISIDAVEGDRFAAITRSGTGADDVLRAVGACLAAGFERVKLNAVLIRGLNEDQTLGLAGLARRYGVEVRFIEYMPLDSARAWDAGKFVPAEETRAVIEGLFGLAAAGDDDPRGTAVTYRFADGAPGRIGFIAPVSRPFCGACSRLRVTADGKVRPCLFSVREWDLRPLLRGGADDEALMDFLIDVTWTKQAGHGMREAGFVPPARPMSAIGG